MKTDPMHTLLKAEHIDLLVEEACDQFERRPGRWWRLGASDVLFEKLLRKTLWKLAKTTHPGPEYSLVTDGEVVDTAIPFTSCPRIGEMVEVHFGQRDFKITDIKHGIEHGAHCIYLTADEYGWRSDKTWGLLKEQEKSEDEKVS